MAGKLGKFQFQSFTGWAPYITKRNHISAMYGIAPLKATNVLVELLARKYKKVNAFLDKLPTKEFDTSDEYTWDIVGPTERNIPLVEARNESGVVVTSTSGMVGAGTAPFYLVFAEPWFFDGEVIVGNLNELYPMRILGEPRYEGTNALYKVELMGGNTDGIPAERLLAGEKFSVEYAPVERGLSRKVGGIRHAAPVSMRNEFSQIRKFHKVSGDMWNAKMAFGIPNPETGQMMTMWIHEVEMEFEREWNQEKNNILAFGRSNRNKNGEYLNIGKSGEVIRMGAGLYEQMEVSNVQYYNTFSLKLITDALYDLSVGKLDYKDRVFVLRTGERGAIQFSQAALKDASGWTQFEISATNLDIWKKTSASHLPSGGAMKFTTPQITEWVAPNGVYVKLEVDPYYDDPIRNKVMHPNGGPAFSYRYDIFDIGPSDLPNIFKASVKGEPEHRGYQAGMRNPFTGAPNNDYMSYDEDSAGMHRMATTGICVLDPTRTMSIIPAILQG